VTLQKTVAGAHCTGSSKMALSVSEEMTQRIKSIDSCELVIY